jgi:hypothetical protein
MKKKIIVATIILALAMLITPITTPVSADIIAIQVIKHSGLPAEKLGDGTINYLTRCRDYVNAYRQSHSLLYTKGWYKNISADHLPLLKTLIQAIESEGYRSVAKIDSDITADILAQFFKDSSNQNAVELGYRDINELTTTCQTLLQSKTTGDKELASKLMSDLDKKWK